MSALSRLRAKNPKRARFALEYVKDCNAAAAAIRAGYAERNAKTIGRNIMRDPLVQETIASLAEKITSRIELTAERTLEEIKHCAYVDPADFFDERGRLRPIREIPERARRAIAGIDVVTDKDGTVTHKIRLVGKAESLKLAGQYFKLFTDRTEFVAPQPVEIKIVNA